ncbi:type-2 ice-structuring protein-like [Thunnus thynnus]|uniref:type-2 ice-structuring protein-like n=1 Tax=Thunnus thynnus TaxID=8237 RepID=UPI003526CF46
MLTVFLFLCAMMALTPSAAYPIDMLSPIPVSLPPISEPGFFFSCPDGWTMSSTQCLLYVPTNMTWAEAEENCRHNSQNSLHPGGTLASVYDSSISHEIHDVLKSAGNEHGKVWVGGFNTAQDPSWYWSDYMGYNQFHDFCSEKHKHHCLQITFEEQESGCLDDMDCDAKLPSICAIILM